MIHTERILFEDLLDDLQARQVDTARQLIDADEEEQTVDDMITTDEDDVDPNQWDVVLEYKMQSFTMPLHFRPVRTAFETVTRNLLEILNNSRYITSHSRILWTSVVPDASFAEFNAMGFGADERTVYVSVGVNFSPNLRYKSCLRTLIVLYNAFRFILAHPQYKATLSLFTKKTFLMCITYLRRTNTDEFFEMLKSGTTDPVDNFVFEKIYNSVDFLCRRPTLGLPAFREAVESLHLK